MDGTNASESKHFKLHPLTEGVFAAIASDGGAAISNSGLIDLGGQIVVFDTFLTPQAALDLRQACEGMFGQAPDLVLNSHYHNDHIWGNQVFVPAAQVISSEHTRQLITTDGKEELDWYSANAAQKLASFQIQFEKATSEQERKQLMMWIGYYTGLVEALPHLKVCLPGITFNGQLEIHGSQRTARLITFEGAHTASDTVLYLPQDGVVFAADLLFVGCHPYLADGDPQLLLQALKTLSQLDATTFVPGHGPVGSQADLRLLMAYVKGCFETARGLIGGGGAFEDRIAGLEPDDMFRTWALSQFYPANIRFVCQQLSSAKAAELK
jgi:cyclase